MKRSGPAARRAVASDGKSQLTTSPIATQLGHSLVTLRRADEADPIGFGEPQNLHAVVTRLAQIQAHVARPPGSREYFTSARTQLAASPWSTLPTRSLLPRLARTWRRRPTSRPT